MGRLTRNQYIRKPGAQVPQHVLDLMDQLHPTVEIMWDNRTDRWVLVQTIGGISQLVSRLPKGQLPTVANTVYVLNACHPSRLRSEYARERFLAKLDENPAARDAERRASDAIRVGSSDLFDQMHGRVVVPVRG